MFSILIDKTIDSDIASQFQARPLNITDEGYLLHVYQMPPKALTIDFVGDRLTVQPVW